MTLKLKHLSMLLSDSDADLSTLRLKHLLMLTQMRLYFAEAEALVDADSDALVDAEAEALVDADSDADDVC